LVQNKSLDDLPFNNFTIIDAEKGLRNLGLVVYLGSQINVNGMIFAVWLRQHLGLKQAGAAFTLNQQESSISASIS